MDTQTQIDRLIELAIVQRAELKKLVSELPQLREHLNAEIERVFESTEPQLRTELEDWTTKQAHDQTVKLGSELEAKIAALSKSLEATTQTRYNAIMAERAQNIDLAKKAEDKLAEVAQAIPVQVKQIVTDELARFPRAGEIDQLRKEFAEPRGLNPRGRWQVGETYNKLDLVSYNGDSYVSSTDGNREKPSRSSEAWTLSAARGNGGAGGGVTSLTDLVAVPANGELLIGNGSAFVNNTITGGTGVTVTNGPGTITIDASGAQELLTATVTNAESFAITRGQVVYLFGATGNRASVKLANNSADATSAKTFGVVSDASIAANGIGTVTCVGVVDKLVLGSYTDGDTLYLGNTPGSVTATKPYAPNHLVYVGIVERANNGNGELYVKIQNGYELDEIHDVQITSAPLAGSLLMHDATNSLWKANRLTGTANQVTVTNADTSVTLSLPTTIANVNSVTAATTQNLTLAGGSTGASLVLGQGASGNAVFSGSIRLPWTATPTLLSYYDPTYTLGFAFDTSNRKLVLRAQSADSPANGKGTIAFETGATPSEIARFAPSTGNLLIGTTTDSGNGKLQLATHTTSAGGIGFGTDTAMFRDTAGGLQQAYSAGTTTRYRLVNNTGNASVFSRTGTTTTISSDDGAVVLASNNTTALTLASNQAATFAGAVTTANKFAVSAYASNSFLTGNCSGFLDNYYNGGSGFDTMSLGVNYDRRNNAISSAIVATGDLRFEQGTGGQSNFVIALGGTNTVPTDRFTIASTGNATFAGAVTVPDSTGLYFGSSARLLWNSGSSSVDVVNTAQSAFLGFRSLTVGVTSTTPSTGAGSGALQVAGGIYAGSASVFGGAVTVNGGLSIPANTFLSIGTFGGATGFKQDTPTTDSIEIWNKGLKVALIGQSQMTMLGAAGGGRFVNFATGTTSASLRWVTGANGTAESGSNAGSDYQIHRYSDAGASLGTAFSITRDTAAATFSGAVTANGQLIAKGTATNDSAATGYIGEYVTATLAYASRVTLATGTAATITSVSLTAGDWDVEGTAAFDLAGVTLTSTTASIGTTGAATGALGEISQNAHSLTTATVQTFQPTPIVRISLSGTTTVYITCNSSFSAGTLKAFGFIRARRVR